MKIFASDNGKFNALIFTIILFIHLFFINRFFPFSEIFNDSPIFNYDHPFHQQRSLDRVRYISDGGVIWGYNPRLMAGYADGIYPLNDGITHWINYLLRNDVGRYTVYKLWVMLLLILPVFIVPLAAALFGFKREWAVSSALTAILLNSNVTIRNYYLVGMGPFVFANFISLLSIAAFWNYSLKKSRGSFLVVLFLLPLSFLIHPLSFVLEIIGFCTIFLGTVRWYRVREWIRTVLLVGVTIWVNWHWIKVFIGFRSLKGTGENYFFQSSVFKFISDYFTNVPVHKLPTIGIIILGGIGLWIIRRHTETFEVLETSKVFLFRVFLIIILPLSLLPYIGGSIGLSWIQPYRFNISLPIFLLPLAAYSGNFLFHRIRIQIRTSRLKTAAFFIFIGAVMVFWMVNFLQSGVYQSRITTRIPDEVNWLAKWLKQNTDKGSRIALQEKGPRTPVGDSHFMAYIAAHTGRELISAYHYKADSVTVYGSVTVDENFAGIPFKQLNRENLRAVCEQYNIRTVVLHDDSSKKRMRALSPVALPVARYGPLEIFRINISPSFFLIGAGKLAADLNSIKVRDANHPITVIKYHYFQLLKTKPELAVERYPVPYDPVGFIKVINGTVSEFEIYADYHGL